MISPIHPRSLAESAAWKESPFSDLPSYLLLCKLEYKEIDYRFKANNSLMKAIIVLGVCLGFGHILTDIGRRASFIVIWKIFRFMLLCLGYWTDDIVEMYEVHSELSVQLDLETSFLYL